MKCLIPLNKRYSSSYIYSIGPIHEYKNLLAANRELYSYILDFLYHPLNICICNSTLKMNTVQRNHITLICLLYVSATAPSSDRICKISNGNYQSLILKTGALSQLIYYKVYIYIYPYSANVENMVS